MRNENRSFTGSSCACLLARAREGMRVATVPDAAAGWFWRYRWKTSWSGVQRGERSLSVSMMSAM